MTEPEVDRLTPYFVRLEHGETYEWCACGRSGSQPFCDGSHEGTGLEPYVFVHDGATNDYSLCACKHTQAPPICDGAHRALMVAEDERADAMELRFPAGVPARDEQTAECEFGACVPDLPVRDGPAAVRYYSEILGFEMIYDDALLGFDHIMYACMGRGDFHLILDEHRANQVGQLVNVTCEVSDVDALHAELTARGANITEGLTDRPWQAREFAIEDLNGHRIAFHMPLQAPVDE